MKLTSLEASANDDLMKQAKAAAKSGNVLIVGHSNTVPDIVAAQTNLRRNASLFSTTAFSTTAPIFRDRLRATIR